MDWSEGYVTGANYTYGYYNDFNPARIPFLFSLSGITPPAISTACELGYGQGVSLNIFAAAETVAWHGTDFNPSQAENAREMATASGARAYCYADSFRDFCEREDLPAFDYIALHGIWSWISRENQAEIVRLIDRKLRVGGVVYISYNTYPGWATMVPAREIMKAHAQSAVTRGEGIDGQVRKSLEFIRQLMALHPAYAVEAPRLAERLDKLAKQNRNYLAHEFLNEVWQPDNFAYMAKVLGEARLTYACSAAALECITGLGLTKEQAEFLNGIADPVLRQMAHDFIRNTQFRKDFWVKGKTALGKLARSERLRGQTVLLVKRGLTNEIKSSFGTVTIAKPAFDAIMAVLGDMKPHTLGELENAVKNIPQTLSELLGSICALLDFNALCLVQKKEDIAKARATSERLNQYLENRALDNADIPFLASPVSGGGVNLSRFEQIFLYAMRKGHKSAEDMARFLWAVLLENGERITRDGQPLRTEEETLPHLVGMAEKFMEALPSLRALQVA